MDFGVVFQCDPPASTVVDLARKAEDAGFGYVWTFDSHLLWQEPFVIYSQILATTQRVIVGPMVTNPGTRDWTVIASQFATLNEMFGNRTICGIGRGDSALRTLGAKPGTIAELKQCVEIVRSLARGETVEYRGQQLKFAWVDHGALDVWVAAYGPKALAATGEVGDGYILQLADPDIAAWMITAVRRRPSRPAVIRRRSSSASRHRRTSGTTWTISASRPGGSAGWSATTSPTSSRGTATSGAVPQALTDYIEGRKGYDYAEHGRAGNTHTAFVPDEVVDRFCILGPVEDHLARLAELKALGVDQFAVYLQHDAKEETLAAYGKDIIPAF